MIEDAGHTVELHRVHTEDKYILTIFRIPSKQQNPKMALFMHGTLKPLSLSFSMINYITYCELSTCTTIISIQVLHLLQLIL